MIELGQPRRGVLHRRQVRTRRGLPFRWETGIFDGESRLVALCCRGRLPGWREGSTDSGRGARNRVRGGSRARAGLRQQFRRGAVSSWLPWRGLLALSCLHDLTVTALQIC